MKFRISVQTFQSEAMVALATCFEGQPLDSGLRYRIDPALTPKGQTPRLAMEEVFHNADLAYAHAAQMEQFPVPPKPMRSS